MVIALSSLSPLSTALGETIVYDNTTNYAAQEYLILAAPAEGNPYFFGNTITLVGVDNVVTGIDLVMRLSGVAPATFDGHVLLFTSQPPDGRPGTLIWDSGLVSKMIEAGAPALIHWDVPNVTVPNSFVWLVRLLNRAGNTSDLGLSQYYPPTVGSVLFGAWRSSTGTQPWLFGSNVTPFGARVTAADPIPTASQWGLMVMSLLLILAAIALIRRRCAVLTVDASSKAHWIWALLVCAGGGTGRCPKHS
jgi:hypothetical protein